MKLTFAVLLLCTLSLVACTPPPPPPSNHPTSTASNGDCNSQPCLSGKLNSQQCKTSALRKFTLSVTNTSPNTALYRLDYYVQEVALEQGDNPGHLTIERGQTQKHDFVSGTFNRTLKITVAQLTQSGEFIADDKTVDITLKPC